MSAVAERPRLSLPEVTLICVDTRTPELAITAMLQCMAQIDFGEVLLFTDPMRVPVLPPGIHIRGARIDTVADYSQFMLNGLAPHVFTRHALIVQWDGFVVDATQWDPDFLLYDYIGAPLRDLPPERAVGNGGFSLRSRRLLVALRQAQLKNPHPEDLAICVENRDHLEQVHDIRYAPLDMARRFAYERLPPEGPTFGFHGLFNMHQVLAPEVLDQLLREMPDGMSRSLDAHDLCRTLIRLGRLDSAELLLAKRRRLGLRDRRTLRLKLLLAWARLWQRGPAAPARA
ncbi:MAG: hypothetical protein KBC73_12270 [Burkholderiaceae bacterium]|nr:hypothetical protein [Burkholderiaceae bacterium]